jgi:uncharacterized protein YggE
MLKPFLITLSSILTLTLTLTLTSAGAAASTLPDYPFVHVSGSAFQGVMPDIAALDFEIVVVDADPVAGRAVLESRVGEVRALMQQLGLDADDAGVREVRQVLRKGEGNAPAGPQYELRCDVHINVRNVAAWPALAGGLFGKRNLDGFASSFDLSTMEQVTDELTAQAVGNARHRADAMAAGFGRRVGPVMGATAEGLKNLSTAMGLERDEFRSGRSGGKSGAADVSREQLLLVPALRLQQSVDVIFRLDNPAGRARAGR